MMSASALERRCRRILRILASKMTVVADVAHRAELIIDDAVEAVAIDTKHWRIALNPNWCEGLYDGELEYVLAHELFHVLLRTGQRGEGTDAVYWNFAHDMVINQRLTELLGRRPPKGGVILPSEQRLSAESVYVRARSKQYANELHEWARSRWQVDTHPEGSPALSNERTGHAGAMLMVGHAMCTYVAVDSCAGEPAGELDVVVNSTRLTRPWPAHWSHALRGTGARKRSWMRPSRRSELAAGRYRAASRQLHVIFEVTPAMLSHAARCIGWLRAFAVDNEVEELRLVCVDEQGIVADLGVVVSEWHCVRFPRAVIVRRNAASKLVDGIWVCGSCDRPHASVRATDGPPAITTVDRMLRADALFISAPA
jgi:hypothetical protein